MLDQRPCALHRYVVPSELLYCAGLFVVGLAINHPLGRRSFQSRPHCSLDDLAESSRRLPSHSRLLTRYCRCRRGIVLPSLPELLLPAEAREEMSSWFPQLEHLGIRLACWALLLGLSLVLTHAQMTHTTMLVEERVKLERYMDETAPRPFIFRVLVPRIIHGLKATIPDTVGRPIADRVVVPLLPRSLVNSADRVTHFYLAGILVLSLIGYALVAGRLYLRLFPGLHYPEAVPVGMLALLLPFVAGNVGHIYDYTLLFFMVSLWYAIATHQHFLFLGLFTVSCFNKETTVFAAIAYACYFVDRISWKALIPMVLTQGVIFSLIYLSLRHHYAGNPGRNVENWTASQFAWLGRQTFADYLSWLGGILLVAYHWPDKPLVMRRTAWVLVPHLCLVVTSAFPGEVRNLYESVPLLSLFVLRNIQELVGGSGSPTCFGESVNAEGFATSPLSDRGKRG